jgi:eukaryotic-like serine/threonine-protein kinase
MPGWCNGSAGHVFLWSLANQLLGSARYLDLAVGASWNCWDSPDPAGTLCCGLVGRSYALLNLYRHSGETVWLERARDLAVRASNEGRMPPEYPHSLYKGHFGLAVLGVALERPDEARMPFFEPTGYSRTQRGAG